MRLVHITKTTMCCVMASASLLLIAAADAEERTLEMDEAAIVLDMLAVRMSEDYGSIKTWQGEYQFEDIWMYGKPSDDGDTITNEEARQQTTGVVEFAFDAVTDRMQVFYNADSAAESNAKPGDFVPAPSEHWIQTPEHYLEIEVGLTLGQFNEFPLVDGLPRDGGSVAFRKPTSEFGRKARVVDVREFYMSNGIPHWKKCEIYAATLRGDYGEEKREKVTNLMTLIERTSDTGRQYVLTVDYPNPQPQEGQTEPMMQTVTTYDEASGYHVTLTEVFQYGKFMESQSVTYREDDGIFLPEKVAIRRHDSGQLGASPRPDPRVQRNFTLTASTLNAPVDSNLFTVEKLGLGYGDRFVDQIENKLFVMDRDGLVAAKDFIAEVDTEPAIVQQDKSSTYNYLVVFNGVVLLVVAAIYFVRRK